MGLLFMVLILTKFSLCFRPFSMDLAQSQGDHEVNRTHAQIIDDSSGGADRAHKES